MGKKWVSKAKVLLTVESVQNAYSVLLGDRVSRLCAHEVLKLLSPPLHGPGSCKLKFHAICGLDEATSLVN